MGRVRAQRFGPRLIDIDILLYDNLSLTSYSLTIPHPRLIERAFVLRPLADIAPDMVHPAWDVPCKNCWSEWIRRESRKGSIDNCRQSVRIQPIDSFRFDFLACTLRLTIKRLTYEYPRHQPAVTHMEAHRHRRSCGFVLASSARPAPIHRGRGACSRLSGQDL